MSSANTTTRDYTDTNKENQKDLLLDGSDYLTTLEVMNLLRVTRLTLRRWERKGYFVQAVRIGPRRDRRYKKSEVLKFLNAEGGVQE